ncbi:hypothetical protein TVAG_300870 [Trichomonas vaginalis G3]|uniref:Uncharacterized protein n=1 Tax=Trichomonas vaginalis (strain ATCC PRA-98 / G3) TaxID=412133 RepID=A2FKL8_TRIV3|nr:hypothetical protein TVAGG3_0271070 [Trichomonas vaginalis G3]EAX94554.1 hypothetical protein TVAG_300870 [Trichomonas vaginalis G3]KAI5525867.1 hypothetical protein TVAGG3_0271070 [Trichomonas vaginalis G3]|eukprot:XP_001307484.1 hypothetical protein [Trichomonas vaginalis G3]
MERKEQISPELQAKIDEELAKYESISKETEQLEQTIRTKLKTYDELLTSYQNALKIIVPKMEYWGTERKKRVKQLSKNLKEKWEDPEKMIRTNPKYLQDAQLYDAIVRIRFKKTLQLQNYYSDRNNFIREKVNSILL